MCGLFVEGKGFNIIYYVISLVSNKNGRVKNLIK